MKTRTYRLTRWAGEYAWMRWTAYDGAQKRGMSRRFTLMEFERKFLCHPSEFKTFYPENQVSY